MLRKLLCASVVLLVLSASARAEVTVQLDCQIPASSGFDCNLLSQRFFKDAGHLPYVTQVGAARHPVHALQISVGRIDVDKGYEYSVEVTEKDGSYHWLRKKFEPSTADSTAVSQDINVLLQQGANGAAEQKDAATVKESQADVVYGDPYDHPVGKAPGRWAIQPSVGGSFSKYSTTPASYNANGALSLNYSGDRVRYSVSGIGMLNRQSITVGDGGSAGLYPVTTRVLEASGAASISLDKESHFNLGLGAGIYSDPVNANLDRDISATVGIEYNAHPYLKSDSKTFAIGCHIGPEYFDFDVDNYLGKGSLTAITQGCAAVGTLLLDKRRGNSVSLQAGENWNVSHPDVIGVNASASATLRMTDNLSISPMINVTRKTKSIVSVPSDYAPSLDGLTPQQTAKAEVNYAGKESASSTASYTAGMSLTYTFGDGANMALQDKRGSANH